LSAFVASAAASYATQVYADDQRLVTASNRRPDLVNALNYIAAGVIFWCSVFRRWSMPGPEET
jgi:hypothetical protein